MHFFTLHPRSPLHVFMAFFCILLASTLSHAALAQNPLTFDRAKRPLTSQNGHTLEDDVTPYRAHFDTKYNVDTSQLTVAQFVRLSAVIQAYQHTTEEALRWQGLSPNNDAENHNLTDAIQDLIEFVMGDNAPMQNRVLNFIACHLIYPQCPNMLAACAIELKNFLKKDILSDKEKALRLQGIGHIHCAPRHLISMLKHRLYMPRPASEDTLPIRQHTITDMLSQKHAQKIQLFFTDDSVCYKSMHSWPLIPAQTSL